MKTEIAELVALTTARDVLQKQIDERVVLRKDSGMCEYDMPVCYLDFMGDIELVEVVEEDLPDGVVVLVVVPALGQMAANVTEVVVAEE